MINGPSSLYKSWCKHTFLHLLFTLLHPWLRTAFPVWHHRAISTPRTFPRSAYCAAPTFRPWQHRLLCQLPLMNNAATGPSAAVLLERRSVTAWRVTCGNFLSKFTHANSWRLQHLNDDDGNSSPGNKRWTGTMDIVMTWTSLRSSSGHFHRPPGSWAD